MAHEGGHGAGGALKEFFLALGLDADSAAFASAEAMVLGLEKGLEVAFEAAEKLADIFVETIHETVEWGEELDYASKMLGQSTEALQLLDYEAKMAHVSSEEMRMGFVHLARSMAEARDGNYELQNTFARLGTRVLDSKGQLRDQTEVLEDAAEGIKNMKTQADRLSAAQQIFGRSGARLLPFLMKGKEGFAELREEAEALGIVISGEQVEAAAKAGEGLKKLGAVAASLQHEIAGPLIEALQPFLDSMLTWVKANRALLSQKVKEWGERLKVVIEALGKALLTVVQVLGFAIDHWQLLLVVLGSVAVAVGLNALAAEGAALAYMQLGLAAVGAALRSAAAWLATIAPIALMAAGIALLILGVQDFVGFLEGKDSLIGRIFQGWAKEALNVAQIVQSMLPSWAQNEASKQYGGAIDYAAGGLGKEKARIDPGVLAAVRGGAGMVPGGQFIVDRFMTGGGGPTAPASGGKRPVSVQTTNQITVHAGPGSNPKEVADEIAKRQKELHDSTMREAYESASGG